MSAPLILSCTSTKGGVGKTTLTANIAAVLADIGFRVLMVDADVQPSLSKFYPLSHRADAGIVELLLGENSDALARSIISHTVYPNLDIIVSNNISRRYSNQSSQPCRPCVSAEIQIAASVFSEQLRCHFN